MISSLSAGDVIDLEPHAGPLASTEGFPSYPTTFLVRGNVERLFDRYWNQNVYVADLLNLADGTASRLTVFAHKWTSLRAEGVDNRSPVRILSVDGAF